MKGILIPLTFITVYFNCNIATAQQKGKEQNDLKGELELTVDVSQMKDTAGKFRVMIGGEVFNPEIKNNEIIVHKLMGEPRRAILTFYPSQVIKANPGKSLNDIAAEVSDYFDFLAVPGNYKINVKGTISGSEFVNPSPHQKKFAELLKLKENFNKIMQKKYTTLLQQGIDKRIKDSVFSVYRKHYREEYPKYYQDTILGFVKDNPDAPSSLFELDEYSYDQNKNLKTISFLYNNLTNRLKALPTGKHVNNAINHASFNKAMIGKQALDFTQQDHKGNLVSLKDFKGNITLVEFWASWCGPCRIANPGLVKAYNKYSNKGFRILGVSLDKNKESWLKAIKDDGLPWAHVSDLKEFNSPVVELYHINGIPSNVLIDKSGKIIATDLDEEELNEHLKKLLQ